MFLIFLIIIVITIIVKVCSMPVNDNKSANQNDNNINDDIEDFIILDMINKNRK